MHSTFIIPNGAYLFILFFYLGYMVTDILLREKKLNHFHFNLAGEPQPNRMMADMLEDVAFFLVTQLSAYN